MSNTNPPSHPPRFVALQHRDFRLIWIGQLISMVGTQMQMLAVNWHIAEILKHDTVNMILFGRPISLQADALGLGALGLVRVIPILLAAPIGGMVADTFDRRLVLIWSQGAAAIFAGMLAAITIAGRDSLIAIYLLTAVLSATTAFDNPARQSLIPNLVPSEHLTNAVSLNMLMWQFGRIVGPTLAGVMLGFVNIGSVYAVNSVSYLAVLVALAMMSYRGLAVSSTASGVHWNSLKIGLRFVWRARLIRATMLLDFGATFFSSSITMLPLIARDVLHTDAIGFGILSTADAAGAILAGFIMSMRRDVYHQGMVLLVSVLIYGLATALFGISTIFVLSYFFFALTGAADTVSTVIRSSLRQLLTPDNLRGRMTAVNQVFFMGGPQLGELEAGIVASALGVPFAVFSGGVATILLTLWVAWKFPHLRKYTMAQFAETAAEMSGI